MEPSSESEFLYCGDATERQVRTFVVESLLRLARLDVLNSDALSFRPAQERAAVVLGAFLSQRIARGLLRHSMICTMGTYDAGRGQRQIDFYTQAFAVEVIQNVEQAESAPVIELAGDYAGNSAATSEVKALFQV